MESLARAWLARQCGMIPGATQGIVLRAGDPPDAIAVWPEGDSGAGDLLTAGANAL